MLTLLAVVYRHVLRPLLFFVDAERAHQLVALLLVLLHRLRPLRALLTPRLPPSVGVEVFGRRLRSPVGVAAGFDKAGTLYNGLGALGFGLVEVGTVTARAQPGNPRPRLFRLPADGALLNRMGFNNPGAEAVARAVAAHRPDGVLLGVNIGKSKLTPLTEAPADYAESARLLAPLADYLVVNVSSPNTPGLRTLQSVEPLRAILEAVQHELAALPRRVPLLVKIAPDLADEDVDAVADLALALGLDGIIATNTTVSRAGLATAADEVARLGDGGISGAPVRARALAVLRRLRARAGARLVLVAAGGIFDAGHAWEALAAGATFVQVYTGLVYRGPDVARALAGGLAARLERSGRPSLAQLADGG